VHLQAAEGAEAERDALTTRVNSEQDARAPREAPVNANGEPDYDDEPPKENAVAAEAWKDAAGAKAATEGDAERPSPPPPAEGGKVETWHQQSRSGKDRHMTMELAPPPAPPDPASEFAWNKAASQRASTGASDHDMARRLNVAKSRTVAASGPIADPRAGGDNGLWKASPTFTNAAGAKHEPEKLCTELVQFCRHRSPDRTGPVSESHSPVHGTTAEN
jgi:hypothetical protein